MPQVISATQARNQFADILARVVYTGEEFVVQKQGKPVAIITKAVAKAKNKRLPRKLTGTEFLLKLAKYNYRGGPKNLARDHDKYAWG